MKTTERHALGTVKACLFTQELRSINLRDRKHNERRKGDQRESGKQQKHRRLEMARKLQNPEGDRWRTGE